MTLLEVMVAMVLLTVLGFMASKGLAQVIRARDVVYDEQARWRNIAMAWARIGEDVTTTAGGLPMEVAEVHWKGRPTAAQWAIWGAAGSVLPVQYSLRNGTLVRTLGADLSRRQSPELVSGRTGAMPTDLDSPILSGVQSMAMAYLDDQGEWRDQWPVQGSSNINPRALRVTLTLDDGRDVTRMYALP